jgi:hypothetical protein
MPPPLVFVSYSHDSDAHKEWVKELATSLRAGGIDAVLDQWDLAPGEDIAAFMERCVTSADRVLLVCSERYVEKANRGDGGVGYERLIVSGELVNRVDTKKFIPIVRQTTTPRVTPTYVGPRKYLDFSIDAEFTQRVDELLREIHGVGSGAKPPLGANPFAAVAPAGSGAARMAGPSGLTRSGQDILADPWFVENSRNAQQGLSRQGLAGAMEVRLALHDPVRKSQLELLNAVRESEIHTFGWPLAVTLENRDEYRPRPIADGIRAEIAISEGSLTGRKSYDYWVARSNGDFYTLQNFFEDERAERALFFNTRIVRITEVFLFAANLYERIGAAEESRFSVSIAHQDLAGRALRSSSPNRHILARTATASESASHIIDSVGSIRTKLVDHVTQVAAPMFMLFDFTEFQKSVYDEIVRNFEQGKVT